ncbi:uncharacterized protein [Littorina saxatilis]|uniref:Uncharacterized protein n=1 Tax=Littorina saxatilis TaxID=31220 RepID=A0AAN9G4Y3_9CAEN
MDKSKAKEKIKYVDKLDAEPRSRYLSKLKYLNDFDPYDCPAKVWSLDVNKLPNVLHGDIWNYLVYGGSSYTHDQFKSYKSLEAHNQFTHGWVHDLKIFCPDSTDNTVVKAKVLHSMRLNEKPLLPWVVVDSIGTVVTSHCDCMAGLGETFTHVGALLFKLEFVCRIREKTTVTGVPAYWMIPSGLDKVEPCVVT